MECILYKHRRNSCVAQGLRTSARYLWVATSELVPQFQQERLQRHAGKVAPVTHFYEKPTWATVCASLLLPRKPLLHPLETETVTSVDIVSSADPMRAITKIISLIDTVRYRNWLRSLVLYISRLYGRIPKTYEWNERKRIFDPNQIRWAWF